METIRTRYVDAGLGLPDDDSIIPLPEQTKPVSRVAVGC
jgi:hypothetical protein